MIWELVGCVFVNNDNLGIDIFYNEVIFVLRCVRIYGYIGCFCFENGYEGDDEVC